MWGTFCGSNQTSSDARSCGQSIFLPEYASHSLPHALVLPILESQPQGLIWPRWNAPDPVVIICAHYATYVSFLVFFIVIVQSFICVHCLWPHGLQHARLSCPSPTPGVYSNSCPLSRWCHPIISSSVVPFSSCLQSFPIPRSFPMCQFFTSGGQSIGVSASASVLPMNIQDWFPLGWTGWISLLSMFMRTPWTGPQN